MADRSSPTALIVIPARLSSTRLERKLLLCQTGRTLLQHTYEAACRSRLAQQVVVATEDEEIAEAVREFGGQVVVTGRHATGTDRIAEAVRSLPSVDIVVNVQGDEPEIRASDIDLAIELLSGDAEAVMSTLATPIRDPQRLADPSCVKVVCDRRGRALLFTRSPVPFQRDPKRNWLSVEPPLFLQHVGLYAYRSSFLQLFASMPQTDWEVCESLEQLRVVEAGESILVGVIDAAPKGIDTAADYQAFVSRHTN